MGSLYSKTNLLSEENHLQFCMKQSLRTVISKRGPIPFMSWSTGLCRVYFSNDLAHCSVCLWAATTHQLIWSSTCYVWDRTSLTPLSVLSSILPGGWASAGWRQKLEGWDEKSREHRATVGWRCCIRKVGEMEDTRCTESGWEGVNFPYSSP